MGFKAKYQSSIQFYHEQSWEPEAYPGSSSPSPISLALVLSKFSERGGKIESATTRKTKQFLMQPKVLASQTKVLHLTAEKILDKIMCLLLKNVFLPLSFIEDWYILSYLLISSRIRIQVHDSQADHSAHLLEKFTSVCVAMILANFDFDVIKNTWKLTRKVTNKDLLFHSRVLNMDPCLQILATLSKLSHEPCYNWQSPS